MYEPEPETHLVRLTVEYIDEHRWVHLHELLTDDQPRLPFDGPSIHSVLAYDAPPVEVYDPADPCSPLPPARFDGDVHTALPSLLIAPVCELCLPAAGVTFAVGIGLHDQHGATSIVPVCDRHDSVPPTITLETLAGWTGAQVLWGELTDPFVGDLLLISDQLRGVTPPPLVVKRYAHELTKGETAAVFADHLRVDDDGQLWLPTWARVVAGIPGTDVPVTRTESGALLLDLDDVPLTRPIAHLPADRGDFVLAVTHLGEPAAPGLAGWAETGPDHATS